MGSNTKNGNRLRSLQVALALAVTLAIASAAEAQDSWLRVTSGGSAILASADQAQAPIIGDPVHDASGIRLSVAAFGLALDRRTTRGGEFVALSWPEAPVAGELGAPALPVVRRLFLAPPGADVSVRTTQTEPLIITARQIGVPFTVLPVQAPVPKIPGARENAPFAYDAAAYSVDESLPEARAAVSEVGEARGERLMMLEVRPVAYNPAAGELRFWSEIDVTIEFTGGREPDRVRSPLPGLYEQVLNPPAASLWEDPRDQSGNYLIVVPGVYAATIADFDAFKASQGFDVTTWVIASGTSASVIRDYIEALYGNPATAPDYVLLVGDDDRIPCWTGAGAGNPATDLYYACMDGPGDWTPDLAVGRFSVRSVAELEIVIDKTVSVQARLFADPRYCKRAVFMASEDNYTISEGTHNYVISNHMNPHDITSDKLYCHTYGATTQQVREAFNDGRLFGVYSGHGYETGWSDGPPFSQSDVEGLTNDVAYAWVSSYACLTGKFTWETCFMETWIRTPHAGAAVAMGSSVNSYWDEDDIMERKMFDLLYDSSMRELGPLLNATKIACDPYFGEWDQRYFEMYNLFGDPSFYVPEPMAMTEISGTIYDGNQGPLTLSGSPYLVVGDLVVPSGYQLTVDPQVTVQFVLGRKLTAGGELHVMGPSAGVPTWMHGARRGGIELRDDAAGPGVRVRNGGQMKPR